ncbi:hypothetical protein CPAST_c02010 [Clostridium pasteurianum DSM 525 = ATCC 6013]|uniref:Uncharacterized protein n=1 Tax=Clostridium pasteurianum DSM 525 = ATCC 6013 TaxID=1262449 RepID=A0A0H3IXU0_CLOPA|nr:hypothetical protein [Clostridium pasteurianum]AJA46301.1 hypothetical protein CPAST_c02010 [Clostridium pasteurianum DSM 525 = ATCC 6013]AJA50289.1 hypothetical protein CLPA_c02010 [Clostridium pasteurianum DSM 525 = ATCC 6013]KRU13698.1 hypothetical protein CP6013_02946 [Clostridium pasteurianum DSM 525 = ATCC 6013]
MNELTMDQLEKIDGGNRLSTAVKAGSLVANLYFSRVFTYGNTSIPKYMLDYYNTGYV